MLSQAEILEQAMELPAEERELIAVRLLGSLKPSDPEQKEIDDAWAEDIERRASAYEKGEVESVDAREAIERIRKTLRRSK
jgi:putative addiction module component (TIGR02574 family)